MNPVKHYQNVSFQELLAYSQGNPNRSATLSVKEIEQTDERILHHLMLPHYVSTVIEPAGILGLCTCITDPNHYYMALPNVRMEMMIELATTLQGKTDELKVSSISRKRKRIFDLIGSSYNQSVMSDKDIQDLFQGISVLCHIQFIIVKERVQETIEEGVQSDTSYKGNILFGTNPIHWKRDEPIWIVDFHGRWIATPHTVDREDIYHILYEWSQDVQQSGWVVEWPEIDETKTELVQQLQTFSTWQETDKKLSKEILAVRLGRMKTLAVFKQFSPKAD
jgi:hypothetical protein